MMTYMYLESAMINDEIVMLCTRGVVLVDVPCMCSA